MKTMVLGDIHGNIIALENVLKFYEKEVDNIVCHGDVVNYGPWSNECVELLAAKNIECLLGNHEEAYIQENYSGPNLLVNTFFNFTFPKFNRLDIIKKYKKELHFENYKVKHTINNKYFYPDTDLSNLQLQKNTIIGHSHYAFHRKGLGGKTLTNTGSIGQNRVDLSLSNFAIVDTRKDAVELVSIKYNSSSLLKEMQSQNYPKECIIYYKNKL